LDIFPFLEYTKTRSKTSTDAGAAAKYFFKKDAP
jgi:hypothetical protein